ncbi:site-specific integrase [Acetobacter pomorum]|uniref:site-specific integrase n=1 Tax=Acetobacter pomorum TaxID=65959 RepID=UPI001E3011A2|nr:site-specific integrase [Acetobacter pomorum]
MCGRVLFIVSRKLGCCGIRQAQAVNRLLALHTAARKSHILTLTWSRVDLQARIIDFRDPAKPRTKKGRARVPINDTLYEALKEAYELRETEFVVEWAGDQVSSIKTGFRAAAKRADLSGITPHTLRHTAATWMAQAGISLWDIAGYLGHSNIKMVEETYAHHCPDYLRTAAGVLG